MSIKRLAKRLLRGKRRKLLLRGDCTKLARLLPPDSIDSIVTDPPYGLGFMGKSWDSSKTVAFRVSTWKRILRVAKPGAYLLAFGGTRTYHRMAVAIEDAGWETRDAVLRLLSSDTKFRNLWRSLDVEQKTAMAELLNSLDFAGIAGWIYSTGFPKSINVSKTIDKKVGKKSKSLPYTGQCPYLKRGKKCRCADGDGERSQSGGTSHQLRTSPSSDSAKEWAGWGSALKPAYEPIIIARKPLEGGLVDNIMERGTGGMNIDECRVDNLDSKAMKGYKHRAKMGFGEKNNKDGDEVSLYKPKGRWPANLMHDGSDEVDSLFPHTSSGAMKREVGAYEGKSNTSFLRGRSGPSNQHGDSGSASRFFYCAKPTKKERDEGCDDLPRRSAGEVTGGRKEGSKGLKSPRAGAGRNSGSKNFHPTIKPKKLMRYLIKLVTPRGGVVLDPFMGSGTTGMAAMSSVKKRWRFIGMERSKKYMRIAKARVSHALRVAEEGEEEKPRKKMTKVKKAKRVPKGMTPLFGE